MFRNTTQQDGLGASYLALMSSAEGIRERHPDLIQK